MNIYRKLIPLLFFFIITTALSQQRQKSEFGNPTPEDFAITSYPQDPDAAGVVIFESANNYVDLVGDYVKLIKEVYVKIKVFDAAKFDQGTVFIPYYNVKNKSENVEKIAAITHNGDLKTYLSEKNIYVTDETPKWSVKKFTFPNIQDGSILEYSYRIESNYYYTFSGWRFQGALPKIYTELHTSIPGNFSFHRVLHGGLDLYINEAEIQKTCFTIPGYAVDADCEVATYAMKNVPAFKTEKFMLSEDNYISRMQYELEQYVDFRASKHPYTRDWKDVETEFRYNNDLGRQLKHANHIKKLLPASLYNVAADLEKAKGIYYNVQNQMAWNGQFRVSHEIDVKEAFERKSGNSSEINLTLLCALDAANLDVKPMLISTRNVAMPVTQFPTINDFTTSIVLLTIGSEKYFLDATDKFTPFGILPLRDLNVQGRVMDFKKGSYWEPIPPSEKNIHYINAKVTANAEGIFKGQINEVTTGVIAVNRRNDFAIISSERMQRSKETKADIVEVSDYQIENKTDLEQPLKENYNITVNVEDVGSKKLLFPFFVSPYFSENPFVADTRTFPIDFGFPITNNYLISIDLADQYEVEDVPANKLLKLPMNDGELSVVYDVSGTKINIRLSARLNNHQYAPEAYRTLQEYFDTLNAIQTTSPIVLKKL